MHMCLMCALVQYVSTGIWGVLCICIKRSAASNLAKAFSVLSICEFRIVIMYDSVPLSFNVVKMDPFPRYPLWES